ncbi:suppressor of fused domain protein [Massilia atriviolacea]|uniref:Suppressor of fused domain protein n=1 Tax=Massilia atriviolacea TaxID=2495579 RepID=A0A430HT60_9BURK|nr:suppressor of fused domain protein [Massilia atriviolacea]RSZ60716.1 suppressor of fused domain protein [Massilia atriviolacea]
MAEKSDILFGVAEANDETLAAMRLRAMATELGEADHMDLDDDPALRINIYAFGRNFVEECDVDAEDQEGYVLVTSGMSDRLMHGPDEADLEETLAVELVWNVPDLHPAYFATLRWLAKLPEIDNTWFGQGHTVPMPTPPLEGCPFKTFLFLPSIIRTDRELFEHIDHDGHAIGTLCVHMISDSEYALVRNSEDGLGEFLDLLDDNDHPHVFNPARPPYV